MGECIEFPNNAKRYVELAMVALEDGEGLVAIDYLEEAVNDLQDKEVVELYLELLRVYREYEQAIEFFETVADDMTKLQFLGQYIVFLVYNRQEEKAERMLQAIVDEKEKAEVVEKMEEARLDLRSYIIDVISHMKKQLLQSHKQFPEERQLQIVSQLDYLEWNDKEELVQELLLHPLLLPMLRPVLLETWGMHSSEHTIRIHWFGKERTISKHNVVSLTDYPIYQDGLVYFDRMIAPVNITLCEWYKEQFYIDVYSLYPFATEYFKTAEEWVKVYEATKDKDTGNMLEDVKRRWIRHD